MDIPGREPISSEAFAELVQQAIADLPPPYATLIESIAVVVEEEPPEDVLQDLELEDRKSVV